MEVIEIKKSDALKAHENAKNSGKRLLEDLLGKKTFQKDVKQRIKTFDDVLEELGIPKEKFSAQCEDLSDDEIAYKAIKLIVKALNEGWTPDWNDRSQYKYYPYFKMSSSSGGFAYDGYGDWFTASTCGSHLCFKSAELAKYAGTQFLELYKDFFTLEQ